MLTIARRSFGFCLGLATVLVIAGCTPMQKSALYGQRTDVPQSQSVDWGTPPVFKLQITKCSWQGADLVADVSMTYSGNDPAIPTVIPVFQLESGDGKHFAPSNAGDATTQLMTTNYNPGSSRTVRLTFPVAHGEHALLVEDGGVPVTIGMYPAVGRVVYVWHIQPSGG